MFNFKQLPPLSLYIHIPWCVKKCPYCDFNSHEASADLPEDAYVDALLYDLEQDLPRVWGRRLTSIFIGGGTPSLLSPDAYARLFSGIRARIPFIHDMEITLEANPGTMDSGHFAAYRELGINRLSIGIQSLDDRYLRSLGRIHDAKQALGAIDIARQAGFDNLNLDMMFGLPGQSLQEARADLQALIQLQPEHISYYQLTIEPNTAFHHSPPLCADDDALADMQAQGVELLAAAGYHRYEVSAYARDGYQCRHNTNYWQFGDYLGIGAGAHAKISRADEQSVVRLSKLRNPRDYLRQAGQGNSPISSEIILSEEDVVAEFALNCLRLRKGFTLDQFNQHTGLPVDLIKPKIETVLNRGLLLQDGEQFLPSEQGYLFLNDLIATFID